MDRNKQIRIGALISYISIFVSIVTGLTYTPWMIHKIGQSDYALYTLAMSLINTFAIDFGLSMATQRYVSKYLAEDSQVMVNQITGLIYKLYIAITALLAFVFFAVFFLIDEIYVQLTPAELSKFKAIYIIVALYSVTSYPFITLNGILSSYERFIELKVCDFCYKMVALITTIAALLMGYGVYALVTVNLFTSILITILRIVIIYRATPLRVDFSYHNMGLVKEMFGFSIWTAISTMAMRLLLSLAPSILGILVGSSDIAIFGYAVALEGYIYMFVNAINGFFMPELSRISASEDNNAKENQVAELMISVGRFILLLFALIFIGFCIMGLDFINLTVGAEYEEAYWCTILICGYGVVAYPQQIGNTYIMVNNFVKKRAWISITMMGINLVLSFVLGSTWGAIGVSLAIFISLCYQTIALNVIYHKYLHIDIKRFFTECHWKLLPGMLIVIMLSYLVKMIPLAGWLGFAVKTVAICCIYFVVMWVLMLNTKEKALLRKMVHKR